MKVPNGKSFRSLLIKLQACGYRDNTESVGWVDRKSLRTAYRTCQRGDWVLWLAAKVDIDRKAIVLAACECARLALVHVPAGEDRPRIAIETAERWARGDAAITLEDVRRAAADAANAANAYAADAAASAARSKTLAQCADIMRKHISLEMLEQAIARKASET